jgi:hypothetical protein
MKKLACAMLFFAACSNEPAQINITKSVGAEGGTVSSSDGTSVVIPQGALAMSSSITINSVNVTPPAGSVQVGPAYDFGPEGTTFTTPVTVTLPFDSSKIPSGRTSSNIVIYTAPRGSSNWTALQTTLSGNTVTTSTNHFTTYVAAVQKNLDGPTDLGSSGNCTPSCFTEGNSCGCSASCGGVSYVLNCSQSTSAGPASCSCTANGSPTATSIVLDNCSATQAQLAFQQQCVPN